MALRKSMIGELPCGFSVGCDYDMEIGIEKNNHLMQCDCTDKKKWRNDHDRNELIRRYDGCCHFNLVKFVEMPEHLQFNGHIRDGYRPPLSAWNCVRSLAIASNETMNILTHGIPLVYTLFNATVLLPWNKITIPALPYFHVMACVVPWLGSVLYHVFMNLDGDERTYNRLLKLDVLGIWFTQTFGALTTVYASIYFLPHNVKLFIFLTYLGISVMALHKALTAVTRWGRRFCFCLQFFLRLGLIFLRMTSMGGGDPRAFRHVVLQDALPLLGGIIGATFVPERWFPGKFDFVGNSHNIMHVVVVAGVLHMHWAATLDLVWLSQCSS